eukprot:SAG22_NODE_2083_length_3036_cov_7.310861_2_plen_158_part_00
MRALLSSKSRPAVPLPHWAFRRMDKARMDKVVKVCCCDGDDGATCIQWCENLKHNMSSINTTHITKRSTASHAHSRAGVQQGHSTTPPSLLDSRSLAGSIAKAGTCCGASPVPSAAAPAGSSPSMVSAAVAAGAAPTPWLAANSLAHHIHAHTAKLR